MTKAETHKSTGFLAVFNSAHGWLREKIKSPLSPLMRDTFSLSRYPPVILRIGYWALVFNELMSVRALCFSNLEGICLAAGKENALRLERVKGRFWRRLDPLEHLKCVPPDAKSLSWPYHCG